MRKKVENNVLRALEMQDSNLMVGQSCAGLCERVKDEGVGPGIGRERGSGAFSLMAEGKRGANLTA